MPPVELAGDEDPKGKKNHKRGDKGHPVPLFLRVQLIVNSI
jgi:hypothetical protein